MIYTGTIGPTELQPEMRYTPIRGWQTVRIWRGSPEAILGLVPYVAYAAINIEVVPDPPYTQLRVTYGLLDDGSQPSDPNHVTSLWTLQGNDLEKSLWEHPKVVAVLDAMDDAGLAQFRQDIAAALEKHTPPSLASFSSNATLVAFYRELLRGTESFNVSQYVLRHTQTVPPNSNVKPSLTNVGKVFSTTLLSTAESIPGTILFTLPDGSWLKRTPTVEQTGNGKFQITQEWWHAIAYSPFLYETAV